VQNRYNMEEAINVLEEDPMYDLATMNQKHEKKRAKVQNYVNSQNSNIISSAPDIH
jgi:hypothetical protein